MSRRVFDVSLPVCRVKHSNRRCVSYYLPPFPVVVSVQLFLHSVAHVAGASRMKCDMVIPKAGSRFVLATEMDWKLSMVLNSHFLIKFSNNQLFCHILPCILWWRYLQWLRGIWCLVLLRQLTIWIVIIEPSFINIHLTKHTYTHI